MKSIIKEKVPKMKHSNVLTLENNWAKEELDTEKSPIFGRP